MYIAWRERLVLDNGHILEFIAWNMNTYGYIEMLSGNACYYMCAWGEDISPSSM